MKEWGRDWEKKSLSCADSLAKSAWQPRLWQAEGGAQGGNPWVSGPSRAASQDQHCHKAGMGNGAGNSPGTPLRDTGIGTALPNVHPGVPSLAWKLFNLADEWFRGGKVYSESKCMIQSVPMFTWGEHATLKTACVCPLHSIQLSLLRANAVFFSYNHSKIDVHLSPRCTGVMYRGENKILLTRTKHTPNHENVNKSHYSAPDSLEYQNIIMIVKQDNHMHRQLK